MFKFKKSCKKKIATTTKKTTNNGTKTIKWKHQKTKFQLWNKNQKK
jgi:hypothetical protein